MMFQFMNRMMGMMGQFGAGQQGDAPALNLLKPNAGRRRAIADGVSEASPQGTPSSAKESPGDSPDNKKDSPSQHRSSPPNQAPLPEELKTPPPKALSPPALSPTEQVATFQAAVSARQEAKKEAKETADAEEPKKPPDSKPKGKAKPKGKGKAKSAQSKAKDNQTKAPADAEHDSGAASAKEGPPAKKAKVASKRERMIYDLQNKPPCMQPGDPTVWYLGGKIHRNGNGNDFRVFLRSQDRNDRKVKVGSSPEESWQKCLEMIEKATDEDKNVD